MTPIATGQERVPFVFPLYVLHAFFLPLQVPLPLSATHCHHTHRHPTATHCHPVALECHPSTPDDRRAPAASPPRQGFSPRSPTISHNLP